MKYYKELKDDGKTVMSVAKVDENGDMIVVCPYRSVTKFTHGEIGNTATPCTFQEFDTIRLITNEFLK